MTGSKLQLYSVGKENSYLTKNPQFSLFKSIYKMHSNFAMQAMNLNFEGSFDNLPLDKPTKLKLTFQKNASLIHKVFLHINLPAINTNNKWSPKIGEIIVKTARIRIGGQIIEEYDSEYMHIYNRQSSTVEDNNFLDTMMKSDLSTNTSEKELYIPLPFWFHRDIGSSLPIYNFTSHDVMLEIELRPLKELLLTSSNIQLETDTDMTTVFADKVWNINPVLNTTYIFLDKSEELRFKTTILQYLVEPVKKILLKPDKIKNVFNISDELPRYPCKEFIIFGRKKEAILSQNLFLDFSKTLANPPSNIASNTDSIISKIGIQFDQTMRIHKKDSEYFNTIQPYMHHETRINYVYNYSFALSPDKFQPSGTCNLTHIPEIFLEIDLEEDISNVKMYEIYIYIRHYDILNIHSGLGDLLLSSK